MKSILEFRSTIRPGLTQEEISSIAKGTTYKTKRYKTKREYLDIWVDGYPLTDLFNTFSTKSGLLVHPDQITAFVLDNQWEWSPAAQFSQILLAQRAGDLPSGRCALLICPECGDLGCGSYAAAYVKKSPEGYVWEHFAWENNWEGTAITIAGAGSLIFEAEQYKLAVNEALSICMLRTRSDEDIPLH